MQNDWIKPYVSFIRMPNIRTMKPKRIIIPNSVLLMVEDIEYIMACSSNTIPRIIIKMITKSIRKKFFLLP